MTINYTSLLSLAEPVTGTQSGTWGDDVNQGLTDYLDIAVAGTQTISGSQTAVTLTKTTGSAAANNIAQVGSAGTTGTAQYAVIRCNGNPASLLTITAPATSKTYVVINATSTNQAVKLVGPGPTTGVTVPSGKSFLIAWNGSDFAFIGTTTVNLATDVTGVLPFANGGTSANTQQAAINALVGTQTANRVLRSDGTNSTLAQVALATDVFGTLPIANGGTNTTATPTAGGVAYGTGTAYAITAAGTAGQVLTSNGASAPTWGAIPAAVSSISFGTTGLTPNSATSGAVSVAGVLNVANGGTALSTYNDEGVLYASGTGALANVSKFGYVSATNRLRNNRYPTIYEWAAGWSQYSSGAFTAAATASSGSATTFLANNLIETSGTYRLGPANNYGNAIVLSNGNFLVYASSFFSAGQPLVGVKQIIFANPTGDITFNTSGSPGSLTNYGTTTLSSTVTLSGLTASTALALDASKNIVSVTNTGSGDNVLATSPTLVTPNLGTPSAGNFSTGTFTWPTFNQNTTGTAGGLSSTLVIASGGTGTTSAQGAMNAFAGAVTAGSYLRGNGTNVVMATIQAADVPTLNQNTTGNAATATKLTTTSFSIEESGGKLIFKYGGTTIASMDSCLICCAM